MAEIHAIVNGDWNAASTWDLNRIPDVDDDVYIGNYEVSINNIVRTLKSLNFDGIGCLKKTANFSSQWICDVNITAITNANAYFGTVNYSGINLTGNLNIDCHLLPTTKYVALGAAVINGNITANGGSIIVGNNATSLTINGDVYLSNTAKLGTQQSYTMSGLLINGTLTMDANHVGPYAQQGVISGNINRQINRIINYSDFPVFGSIDSGNLNFPYVFGDIYCKNNLANSITGYVLFNGKVVCKELGDINVHFTFNDDVTLDISNGIFKENDIVGSGKITNPNGNSDYYLFNVNAADYPQELDVKNGVPYGNDNFVGTYTPDYPPESVVLKDYEYGDSDDRKTGTMVQEVNVEVGCVTPEDVRKDVPLVGMGVVGTLVVPSVDDVREGVVFDNGSVGTLIVQGGGERLRIADFSYYTNAQSDTYIVDLTEQDKPKFAVAEERVLIEMFPDLDLDNIPDKYFDDLFVKYLKYRLIVEYYRTAGINSTFTPSEPTTEIVNYQNVRNEVWLNSANIYLKAWAKKYPNSIKEHRILL